MSIRILAEAEAESQAAAQWYEDRRAGLGVEFLEALIDGFIAIEKTPLRFPRMETRSSRHYRRLLLDRFPYKIIYEIRDNRIWVIAVAHAHRRPNYWRRRVVPPDAQEGKNR